ncbi:hypothetical protein NMW20_28700, partial [Escherichia coli]|nr:hypothetical protein [Escherichia coli]
MIQIDLPTLVKRLNLFSRQALEMAASECMSQQAAEITVSAWRNSSMPISPWRVITRRSLRG